MQISIDSMESYFRLTIDVEILFDGENTLLPIITDGPGLLSSSPALAPASFIVSSSADQRLSESFFAVKSLPADRSAACRKNFLRFHTQEFVA